ncbi:hypothetical protein FSP39_011150 [Pinctada imbricata]|uniref:Transmembrane protein n=1 Tax=Pinctada imbricata TaxID=66713 RepID=A0AA88Y881_PINIB|nr:hypothetical protein FSP39_011150 [Pinctada imbricata]
MRRSTRMKLLCAYLQVVGLVLGVITGVVFYSPIENDLSNLGMKYVSRHLSPVFCEGVSIQSKISETDINTDVKFSAYLMDREPEVLGKYNMISYNETYVKFVPMNGYVHQQFYFLQGSFVHVTANVQSTTTLLVIKGYKNFKSGASSDDTFSCEDCFLYTYTFFPEEPKYDVEVSIIESDDYFFVYQTGGIKDGWVTTNYRFRRTVYDTFDCIDDCKNISNCDFLFPDITGSYGVVIQREKSNFQELVNIQTMCITRVWMFTILFFTLPLIIVIVGSCCIYAYCKEPDTLMSASTRSRRSRSFTIQRSASPLLTGTTYPNYSTVFMPPKYEDVIKTRNGALPSYAEATGGEEN